ncbi:hypothetical protein DL96DRAFT_1210972 [Flagelloscypha sp. PMI_526]|nr:hypothetical protein DL96DRAFT_1210972 [Flagelloscypha sp. PMI_526]
MSKSNQCCPKHTCSTSVRVVIGSRRKPYVTQTTTAMSAPNLSSSHSQHSGERLIQLFDPPRSLRILQHYIWAGGHFLLLLAALRSYELCHCPPKVPRTPFSKFCLTTSCDNGQVALFWWTSKPVAIALIPYAISSLSMPSRLPTQLICRNSCP